MNEPLPHVIEIEELVLTGNPARSAIEAAVVRALHAGGLANAAVEPKADARAAG